MDQPQVSVKLATKCPVPQNHIFF